MTRTSLTILTVLLSTGALAQAPPPVAWDKTKIVPPLEYDYPFPGELKIARLASEAEVRVACYGADFSSGHALACNVRWGKHRCDVYIAADKVLATVGLSYEVTLRHEQGHCNGWPGHHHGARYATDPPAQMPPRWSQEPRFYFSVPTEVRYEP